MVLASFQGPAQLTATCSTASDNVLQATISWVGPWNEARTLLTLKCHFGYQYLL